MSDTIRVRVPTEDDCDELVRLLKTLDMETNFMLMEAGEVNYSVEKVKNLTNHFNSSPMHEVRVCEHQGSFVGYIKTERVKSKKKQHCATLVIGVLKKFWGSGASQLLLDEIMRNLTHANVNRIDLYVSSDNIRAINFYKKNGFVVEGRKAKAIIKDGVYHDELIMASLI